MTDNTATQINVDTFSDGGGHFVRTEIEVRSSGTTQQERLSLRIVGEQNRLRIIDLGMTDKQQARFEEIASRSSGLMVVSGPRASGHLAVGQLGRLSGHSSAPKRGPAPRRGGACAPRDVRPPRSAGRTRGPIRW